MVLKMVSTCEIPGQFWREERIFVTIIEVKSPVHYVVQESRALKSPHTLQFVELEESMKKYYSSLEPAFFQLPVRDTILIVEHKGNYCRAKVCSILSLPQSYLIKVYLLDYGKECNVSKSSLFEIHPDFMHVPFQVVDFKLSGLEPISLVVSPVDLAVDYGPAMDWDPSATTHVQHIFKEMSNAYIKVEGSSKKFMVGTLHATMCNGEEKCINDELVLKKFASQNPDYWNDVTRLSEIRRPSQLAFSAEVPEHVRRLRSPVETSGAEMKIREQGKALSSLQQKKIKKGGYEESKAQMQEDVDDCLNMMIKNIKMGSPEKDVLTPAQQVLSILGCTESEILSEEFKLQMEKHRSVARPFIAHNLLKFKQIAASKKDALPKYVDPEQPDASPALSGNSPSPQTPQSELSSSPPNTGCSKLSESDSSVSAATDNESEKAEKLVCESASATSGLDTGYAKSTSSETSGSQLSIESLLEKLSKPIEVPKPVDPAKLRAFYEFSKSMLRKSQNPEYQQDNARLNPKSTTLTETGTNSATVDTKNVEPPADSAANLVESVKACDDSSNASSSRSSTVIEPREIPLACPTRIIAFYKKHMEAMAIVQDLIKRDEDDARAQLEASKKGNLQEPCTVDSTASLLQSVEEQSNSDNDG